MMLDAHSELAIPPETNFGPAQKAFERGGPGPAIEAIVTHQLWGDFNMPADQFVMRVEKVHQPTFMDILRAFYELYAERQGKSRWGDKSPYYVNWMERITRYLPEARFIHIIRDGRDVALSLQPLWFAPDDLEDLAHSWVQTLKGARHQASNLPFYTEVRYEDLVRDPVTTLQELCDFLKLGWEPGMLEYHQSAMQRLSVETVDVELPDRSLSREMRLDIHQLLGLPPQRTRIGRWQTEMSRNDLCTFESIAGETLSAHGYHLSCAGEPEPGPLHGCSEEAQEGFV